MPNRLLTYDSLNATRLEQELRSALVRHLGDAPINLVESIEYSLLAPGKRIRPRLVLESARMLGLDPAAALPAALALEMIHCFTLIHDDLPCMDDDDFRRGRPSNHKKFGEALALLAGDALVPLAFAVFLDAAPAVENGRLIRGLARLTWASGPRGVIGGQAAESLLTASSTLDQLERMHAGKTGALFSAALLIPKDLAGIPDQGTQGETLDAFAHELGLAFQIADDLDDAKSDGVRAPATSILAHLSREQASQMIRGRLELATGKLTLVWGEYATRLASIASEVLASL
jgi:geranylgeranyl diphosphate synthase, type II